MDFQPKATPANAMNPKRLIRYVILALAFSISGVRCIAGPGTDPVTSHVPGWFRSTIVGSQFCALCEVTGPSRDGREAVLKIIKIYHGRRKDLPAWRPIFEYTNVGERFWIMSGSARFKFSAYYAVKNAAVYPNIDNAARGVNLPTARVSLSEINALAGRRKL